MDSRNSLAPNSKRIWAYGIDDIVVSALFVAIFYNQLLAISTPVQASLFIQSNILVLVSIKIIYHTFFIWKTGKTLGKYFMKIKVVDMSSDKLLTFSMALVRALVRVVSESIFYIGYLPAFFTQKRQTLHDMAAKDVVVNG